MIELNAVFNNATIQHCSNLSKAHSGAYPSSLDSALDSKTIDRAIAQIIQWPGYTPTPLVNLEAISEKTDVGTIYYKDEAHRFGLGSFKALGGAYAVLCLLRQQLSQQLEKEISFDDVRSGQYAKQISQITVTSATDGNHGRSVAWGAQQFGCPCVIYIHAQVSEHREKAMQVYDAQVIRIDGNYDESVHMAAKAAQKNGWYVISDTSYEGYTDPPRNVMAGYCVLMHEVLQQLKGKSDLTHVFIQGGVGGLAGAMNAYLWQKLGEKMPKMIIVEPNLADCLYQSALNQLPTVVDIQQETLMAGLSCGEVSQLGWQILELGASDFLTIDEELVAPTMQLLAQLPERIIAGESAIAGLAALIACSAKPELMNKLALTPTSQILMLGTEGATDPQIYQQLTGIEVS